MLRAPKVSLCTILPLALAGAGSALAQEAPVPLPTVRIQGAYDARRDDTAARIVLGHDDMVRHGDATVFDALKRVPGVTVSGSAGRGAEIRMQGLGNGYTQVLVDGERPPAGMLVDTLSPAAIERIEVLRVASADLSNQSIAGTINIVLRKAPKKLERELKASYAIGRDTRNPNLELRLGDRDARFAYSLAATVNYDDVRGDVPSREEAFDAAGRALLRRTTAGREEGRISGLNVVPQLTWTLDGGDTLALHSFLNVNRFDLRVDAPTTTLLGDEPLYPDTHLHMSNDNDAAKSELRWMHKLEGGGKFDLKIGASASRTGNISEREADGLGQRIDSLGHDHGLQSTGKLTVPLWEGHALALGWQGGIERRTDERRERDLLPPAAADDIDRYHGEIARLAAYAQDEWNLTPRWSMYLGGRWEGVRIRADGTDFGDTRSRSAVFSPVLQTLYKLANGKDQLRLALSRTYKAPSMDKLLPHRYTAINNSQVEPDTAGNPNLKPELALGLNGAWEHRWAEGAMISLAASAREIDDATRYLVQFDGARWVSRPANIGKAHVRSVQLETSFPLTASTPSAPAIDVRANVARNWSRVDAVPGPDNRLDGQTPLSAGLGLDVRRGQLSAGANLNFQNGGTVRLAANEAAYQGVRRDLELFAMWKIDPAHELQISALNVLGQDMVNARSYVNTGSGVLVRNRIVNVGHPSLRLALASRF